MINLFEITAPDRCTHCAECIANCPMGIISFDENRQPNISSKGYERCMRCHRCLASCAPGVIRHLGIDSAELPLTDPGQLPSPEQMERLIEFRRSRRFFQHENVPPELQQRLFAIIANAPTARNNMSVVYNLIDNFDEMDRFKERIYHLIEKSRFNRDIEENGREFLEMLHKQRSNDMLFRNAPHLLVTSTSFPGPAGDADGFIALSYFELLAQSHGIGTLWLGLLQSLFNLLPESVTLLDLPPGHRAIYPMLFGHSRDKFARAVIKNGQPINHIRLHD